MSSSPQYLTQTFKDAARMPKDAQLGFLSRLQGNPFFKPETNDNAYRDMTVFCLALSGQSENAFAAKLNMKPSLLAHWMHGENIPYPVSRALFVNDMIALTLHENGWFGMPAHEGGANVFPLRPETP